MNDNNQSTEMKNFVVRIPVDLESRIKMESHKESLERNTHLRPTDLVREILTRELIHIEEEGDEND